MVSEVYAVVVLVVWCQEMNASVVILVWCWEVYAGPALSWHQFAKSEVSRSVVVVTRLISCWSAPPLHCPAVKLFV